MHGLQGVASGLAWPAKWQVVEIDELPPIIDFRRVKSMHLALAKRVSMQVSPFHAAILLRFKERADWPAAELARELGVTPELLRKRAVFWINKGRHTATALP